MSNPKYPEQYGSAYKVAATVFIVSYYAAQAVARWASEAWARRRDAAWQATATTQQIPTLNEAL